VVQKAVNVSENKGAAYGAPIDEAKRALAEVLEEQLAAKAEIIDWIHKDEVQREMRQLIKRQLRVANYGASELDPVAASVVELLRRRRAH
jgi:type I restriction enzyme R subunit